MAITFSLPARLARSVEIDAVQQRLVSKIEVLRNGSAAAHRAAPGTLLRRCAACPMGMASLIRVAAISSGHRGAAVPRRLRPRWISGVTATVFSCLSYCLKMLI